MNPHRLNMDDAPRQNPLAAAFWLAVLSVPLFWLPLGLLVWWLS